MQTKYHSVSIINSFLKLFRPVSIENICRRKILCGSIQCLFKTRREKEKILIFPQSFLSFKSGIQVIINVSSVDTFNLDISKILLFGKRFIKVRKFSSSSFNWHRKSYKFNMFLDERA